jgi:inositol phosphorylceramide mannosyltransferase catalytic subunit
MNSPDTFLNLLRQSRHFNQHVFAEDNGWWTVNGLFEQNFIKEQGRTVDLIPKKIHQIWLGGELPLKYRQFTESWKIWHPTWEYKLWNDKDADEFGMTRADAYYSSNNLGTRSDIFSYEILRRHGGIYIDTDFECLKPFDDLLWLKYFTSVAYDAKLEIYHGLMASIPEHSILKSCVEDIIPYDGENGEQIMNATGPYHLTRCFLKNVNSETEGVVAFPPSFFYPWPNYERFGKEPYRFIQEHSYAIHHWHVSWLNK